MKKLTLSSYQYVAAHIAVQLIEINRLSDRHFWHEDYDKADMHMVTLAVDEHTTRLDRIDARLSLPDA